MKEERGPNLASGTHPSLSPVRVPCELQPQLPAAVPFPPQRAASPSCEAQNKPFPLELGVLSQHQEEQAAHLEPY